MHVSQIARKKGVKTTRDGNRDGNLLAAVDGLRIWRVRLPRRRATRLCGWIVLGCTRWTIAEPRGFRSPGVPRRRSADSGQPAPYF